MLCFGCWSLVGSWSSLTSKTFLINHLHHAGWPASSATGQQHGYSGPKARPALTSLKIHAGPSCSVSLGKCVTITVMLTQKYQEHSHWWIGLRKEGLVYCLSSLPNTLPLLTGHICHSQFSLGINPAVKHLSRLQQLDLRSRSHQDLLIFPRCLPL